MEDLPEHPFFQQRKVVIHDKNAEEEIVKEFKYQIAPSPKLSNHSQLGEKVKRIPSTGEDTIEVLSEFQIEKKTIDELYQLLKLGIPKL